MDKIDRLRQMSEAELQKIALQPLLRSMGFQDVSIYHGSHEKGKDIICWRRDELGCRRNLALVVKAVRLTGQAKATKGTLSEVSTQVQQCFCNAFTDPVSGEPQQIHQCWVVTNQDITKEAVEQLNALLKPSGYDRNVSFIDHEKLQKLLEEYVPEPPLFQVANHHVPSCGEPPRIDDKKPGQYLGYFENEHGEQAIFIYDQETARGKLYMGDAGWEEPWEVHNGRVPGLIMNRQELIWLTACWEAATTFDDRIEKWKCMYCERQTYEHLFAHLCNWCYTQERNEECKRFLEKLKQAEQMGRPVSLSFRRWLETIEYFGQKCAYCQKNLHQTLDYLLSLRHGGGATADNCLPACRACRDKKRNKQPEDLMNLFPAGNIARIQTFVANIREKSE